jgi:uncharacterized protein (DUF1778 family)
MKKDKKTERIELRLTKEEKEKISEVATLKNLSTSEFVRDAININLKGEKNERI